MRHNDGRSRANPSSAERAQTSGRRLAPLALALLIAAPAPVMLPTAARAQERAEQAQVDSLVARIGALEALIESLRERLRRLEQVRRDTAPAPPARPGAEDELAALREAARRAAEAAAPGPATDTGQAQPSRTRGLQALNPEISVTGDIVASLAAPGEGETRVSAVPREFEFSFQSALDPHTRTKVFITRHEDVPFAGLDPHADEEEEEGHEEEEDAHAGEGGFEIEEGYMYWVGLPGALGLKVGKFRQEIGLYNRWHTHALFEIDRPLPTVAFLGEDGLIQTGVSLVLPSFRLGPATQTVTFEATKADAELFEGGTDLSYLGRFQSFFDLTPRSFLQLGATGVYGQNDELALTSRLLALDVYYRFTPATLYRDLSLKGEWYLAERSFPEEEDITGSGGYVQANLRLDRRWIAGVRGDYLNGFGDEPKTWQLVPSVTYWQSEWVYLRLQYNLLKRQGFGADHTVLVQTVWAVGPHKHETY